MFDGLDGVRVAARETGEAMMVLSMMLQGSAAGEVTLVNKHRPWDFLCYHPQTGTTIEYVAIVSRTHLPASISALEPELCCGDTEIIERYKAAVDRLIRMLISEPIENLCCIHQRRLRRIASLPNVLAGRRCPLCGRMLLDGVLWDVEGVICCQSCCGLDESWFMCH